MIEYDKFGYDFLCVRECFVAEGLRPKGRGNVKDTINRCLVKRDLLYY